MKVSMCSLLLLIYSLHIVYGDVPADSEIVRPELGALLKPIGNMLVSPHVLTLNFVIPFQTLNLTMTTLPNTLFEICDNKNMTNAYVLKICKQQLPSILLYHNLTNTWENRIKLQQQTLLDMANESTNLVTRKVTRKKRGLFMSGVGFALSTGVRALINWKRNKDIKKGMKLLNETQIMQGKAILSLKRELAHYVRVDLKAQGAIINRIAEMEKEAEQTRSEVSNILTNILAATASIDAKTITIPLLSKLVELRANLAMLCFHSLPSLFQRDLNFINNLRDAQRGVLKHDLLTKERLSKTIKMAVDHLLEWQPDYSVLDTNVQNLYRDNRVKISINYNGAIVQLPLEVIKKQTPIMKLFKFSGIPIPLDNATNNMASMIDPIHKFIAISDKHYTLLNEEQINTCHTPAKNKLTICPVTVPMIKLEQSSCLLSIYKNENSKLVYKYCPVLINTVHQFGPQILETGKKILIFGVEKEYQIICEFDNQPQNMKSLSYAVINRALMCKCNIITSNYFLKGYLCEKSEPADMYINVEHPTNRLTTMIIDDIQNSINNFHYVPDKYENVTNAIAEAISKLNSIGKNKIHKTDLHISDLKEKILDQIEQEILVEEQTQPKAIQTNKWFGGELWLLGLSLVCSLIGTLSCACFCYICIKHKQVASVIGAGLLSQSKPVYADSDASIPELKLQLIYLLIQAACTLALAIISYFLLQAVKILFRKYSSAKIPILNQELLFGYPKITVALQILSGTERVVLKMATIYGMIDEIKFVGQLNPTILGFRGSIMGGMLSLNLGTGNPARLSCKNLFTPTPETVPVPWHSVWKIKRLSRTQYSAKVLLIDDYGIAYPLLQDTSAGYPSNELQII